MRAYDSIGTLLLWRVRCARPREFYLFGVGRAGCGGGPLGLPTGIGLEKSGSGENGSAIVLPPFCDRVRLLLLAVDLRRDAYRRRKVLRVDHPCVLGI
jgi:hypothetical protein